MFVKVSYLGAYPLGADVELNGVKIMQSDWNEYRKPVFMYGKKAVISPFFLQMFYITQEAKTIFFAAHEYRLGHYHIFTVGESANEKLSKKITPDRH